MADGATTTADADIRLRALHDRNRLIADVFSNPKASETLGPCSFYPGLPSSDRDRDRTER